eukprot:356126-Chlamydomonas_euryale.AAC.9
MANPALQLLLHPFLRTPQDLEFKASQLNALGLGQLLRSRHAWSHMVTHGHTWSHMFTCHASVCQGSDPKYAPSDACSRSRRASVARGPALLPPPAGSHAVAAPCNEADRATASHPAPAPAPLPPPAPLLRAAQPRAPTSGASGAPRAGSCMSGAASGSVIATSRK